MQKKSFHIQKKGFTLLETLVAVFILTLALTGPIYIASLAIRSSVESRDNISAYHLAEEAIEVIRNKRDRIALQGHVDSNSWLFDIMGSATTGCMNPPSSATISSCEMTRDVSGAYTFTPCSGACPALVFNPAGPILYGQTGSSGGINSKFSREIYLQTAPQDGSTTANPDREVDVVVTVKWQDRGRERQFQIIERLHNQSYADYYIE